jgi:hypothetical protein
MEGLYKNSEGVLIYAQNEIRYPDGRIFIVSDYENFEGEVIDGCYWFNTREEALTFFNIEEDEELVEEVGEIENVYSID